jgi:hypothetical protein
MALVAYEKLRGSFGVFLLEMENPELWPSVDSTGLKLGCSRKFTLFSVINILWSAIEPTLKISGVWQNVKIKSNTMLGATSNLKRTL